MNDQILPIRKDLSLALERAWHRLASPGTWFSGSQRLAIVAESRSAMYCDDACVAFAKDITKDIFNSITLLVIVYPNYHSKNKKDNDYENYKTYFN